MATTKIDLGQVVPRSYYGYAPYSKQIDTTTIPTGSTTGYIFDMGLSTSSESFRYDKEAFEPVSITGTDETYSALLLKKNGILKVEWTGSADAFDGSTTRTNDFRVTIGVSIRNSVDQINIQRTTISSCAAFLPVSLESSDASYSSFGCVEVSAGNVLVVRGGIYPRHSDFDGKIESSGGIYFEYLSVS